MAEMNSQTTSPRNLATSEEGSYTVQHNVRNHHDNTVDDDDRRYEHTVDHAVRVREARNAAQREIDAFGDVSEYELRKVYGQHSSLKHSDPNAADPNAEHEERPLPIPPERYCYEEDVVETHDADDRQDELFQEKQRETTDESASAIDLDAEE